MKRVVMLLIVIVLSVSVLYAITEMEIVGSVDEWGDPTDDSYLMIYTDVFTFSNSVYSNRNGYFFILYFFPEYKSICGAAIPYEYSSSVDKFYIDDIILVKYRDAAKNIVEVKTKRSYNENATFALMGKDAENFVNTMMNTNKIQLIISGTDYEDDTKYNCTFEYDNTELKSNLDTIGWK